MASGIPAVARYDKNLEDVITNGFNGYFFNDTNELVAILLNLIKDDFTEIAHNALLSVKKYSSEVFCEKVLEVYRQAIKSKHYSYTVKSIYPIKNGINEVVFLYDESEIIVEVSDKLIKNYQLKPGVVILETFSS